MVDPFCLVRNMPNESFAMKSFEVEKKFVEQLVARSTQIHVQYQRNMNKTLP